MWGQMGEDGNTEMSYIYAIQKGDKGDYVITTFDLGVCMKAYPLTWNYHEKYKQHIILMGTFHTICAYLRMIGKKMEGSGTIKIPTSLRKRICDCRLIQKCKQEKEKNNDERSTGAVGGHRDPHIEFYPSGSNKVRNMKYKLCLLQYS